jgi:RNA polymerase sigma-70 factor (ECF subfamily)
MLPPEEVAALLIAQRLPLTALFGSVTRDFQAAEDIFQEICVKAVGRAGEFESAAHVANWARLAGRHRAIDVVRSRYGRYEGLSEELLATLAEEWPDAVDLRQQALALCMEEVTPNNRELLRLRYFERRPCLEVAAVMGRKLESVYQALARIHRVLGDCVRERCKQEAF